MTLPKISLVTPCYNSEIFLEKTILSILDQQYPNLEYIIVDGGSTDSTVEIIKKYEGFLKAWVSEPDRGMYDALNKGFALSTGDVLAWSPASDLYAPHALSIVASLFNQFLEIEWLTSLYKVSVDETDQEIARYKIQGFYKKAFIKGYNLVGRQPYAQYGIQQQSTFWRRSLWEQSGARLNDKLTAAGDFELWLRFFQHTNLYAVDFPLGIFRIHGDQISQNKHDTYLKEMEDAFFSAGYTYMNKVEAFIRETFLRKLAARYTEKLGFLYFPAKIVKHKETTGTWQIIQQPMI